MCGSRALTVAGLSDIGNRSKIHITHKVHSHIFEAQRTPTPPDRPFLPVCVNKRGPSKSIPLSQWRHAFPTHAHTPGSGRMDGLIECDFLATNFPSSDSVPVWLTLFIFSANYGLRAVSLIVPPPLFALVAECPGGLSPGPANGIIGEQSAFPALLVTALLLGEGKG
jgi:hypothetical protein